MNLKSTIFFVINKDKWSIFYLFCLRRRGNNGNSHKDRGQKRQDPFIEMREIDRENLKRLMAV
jgi:hypothetical protein